MISAAALAALPLLAAELHATWPSMPQPAVIAAQIEQESRWQPHATLKTAREYGFGYGQFTVTARFDAMAETRRLDKQLSGWTWERRFDPTYQLRAVVVKDRHLYQAVPVARSARDQLAFMLAAYNGGLGGLRKDVLLCGSTAGCDPQRWFGHVAHTSYKARSSVQGYGRSFFQINRQYVQQILLDKQQKYVPWFNQQLGKAMS